MISKSHMSEDISTLRVSKDQVLNDAIIQALSLVDSGQRLGSRTIPAGIYKVVIDDMSGFYSVRVLDAKQIDPYNGEYYNYFLIGNGVSIVGQLVSQRVTDLPGVCPTPPLKMRGFNITTPYIDFIPTWDEPLHHLMEI